MAIISSSFLDKIKEKSPDFKEIFFPGRGVDDTDVINIVNSIIESDNQYIQDLYFPDNDIGDAGCEALSKLKHIALLDISGNNVTDVGALSIAKIPSLKSLDIANNKITKDGFIALLKDSKLSCLDVSNTSMSEKEFHSALDANPNDIKCYFEILSDAKLLLETQKSLNGLFAQKENSDIDPVTKAELTKLNLDINVAYQKIPSEDRDEFVKQLLSQLNSLKTSVDVEAKSINAFDELSGPSW